ncbi:MAG: DUF3089 domain-containing protein [Halioglobus sp.]|nr:DUF3089 domain-containing protein [Halioglobus sp.]
MLTLLAAGWLLSACTDGGIDASPYVLDSMWMCKPGAEVDYCAQLDQDLTDVLSPTSQAFLAHEIAQDPGFDCFYVYPTVDLRDEPGNTEDLTDVSLVFRPLYNQAARFNGLCNLYAPRYRQMTIGSYSVEGGYRSTPYFQRAFADVDAAFSEYLRLSGDRPFVLYGHSQGSHMLLELLARRFENDPGLRERLVSALIIGPVGALRVPEGEIAGGTFDNIPLCTHATDTGCIIAYDSIFAGDADNRTPPGEPLPCVNPTLLGGNPGVLANTIWQDNLGVPVPQGVETQWFGFPELHSAACESDGYLGIDTVPGDERVEQLLTISPEVVQAVLGGRSLHVADVSYTIGDLLRIVQVQAQSMP